MTAINTDKNLFIDNIIKGLEESKDIAKNLQESVHKSEMTMTQLSADVDAMQTNINWLIQVVRDSGDRAVVTRLIMLENANSNMQKQLDAQSKKEETKQDSLAEIKIADKKGKWEFKAAMVASICSFLVALVTAYFSMKK